MKPSLFQRSCLTGLLQPYVDGEASPEQRLQVEAYLAQDPGLQEMVDEQIQVRQTLTALSSESAPSTLQARILLELDAVDREQTLTQGKLPTPFIGFLAQIWQTLRSFSRGPRLLLPVGIAALTVFLLTRPDQNSPISSTIAVRPALQNSTISALPRSMNIANLARANELNPPQGMEFVRMGGQTYHHKGNTYFLSRDHGGRPVIFFEIDGVPHVLTLHDPKGLAAENSALAIQKDYQELLNFGHLAKTRKSSAITEQTQPASNLPTIAPQFVSHPGP